MGPISGLGRSAGIGNGNLLQYACLQNPMEREAWQATVQGSQAESDMTWRLNNNKNNEVPSNQSVDSTELYIFSHLVNFFILSLQAKW